jgi:hypothetical protein
VNALLALELPVASLLLADRRHDPAPIGVARNGAGAGGADRDRGGRRGRIASLLRHDGGRVIGRSLEPSDHGRPSAEEARHCPPEDEPP